jgi:ketosteroid isomerase-like protein
MTAGDGRTTAESEIRALIEVRATTKTGQRLDMWWRATICYRKVDGAWQVIQEHALVPFDVASALDLEP